MAISRNFTLLAVTRWILDLSIGFWLLAVQVPPERRALNTAPTGKLPSKLRKETWPFNHHIMCLADTQKLLLSSKVGLLISRSSPHELRHLITVAGHPWSGLCGLR